MEKINEVPKTETAQMRLATPRDLDGIAAIYLESARLHSELDPERYEVPVVAAVLDRYREILQNIRLECREVVLVAELNGDIVGFVEAHLGQSLDAMHRTVTFCHVSEIAVLASHWNSGLGGRLLHAIEKWGRGMGAEFASLEFHVENKRAESFYQKQAYRPAATTFIKRL